MTFLAFYTVGYDQRYLKIEIMLSVYEALGSVSSTRQSPQVRPQCRCITHSNQAWKRGRLEERSSKHSRNLGGLGVY